MDTADFDFDLPPELIAQQALPERSASRLLHVGAGAPGTGCDDLSVTDLHFRDLPGLLRPGDLLVGNDTRVLPARLFGQKATGGKVEMLLERVLGETEALVQLRSSHAPKPGAVLEFGPGVTAEVTGRQDEFFVLRFSRPVVAVLERARPRPAAALHPPGGRARRPRSATRPSLPGSRGPWRRRPPGCTSTRRCWRRLPRGAWSSGR